MFNLKVSGIVAGTVFIFSFFIGMISRIPLPMLFLRALLFSVLFLVIANLVRIVVIRFLPELLEGEKKDDNSILRPGSRVNITEGEDYSPSQAAPKPAVMGAQPDDSEDGLGNITDLMSKAGSNQVDRHETGMDQNGQDGYTGDEGLGLFSASSLASPSYRGGTSSAAFSDKEAAGGGITENSASVDVLPDLDSMVGVFASASGHTDADTTEYSAPASNPAPKPSSRSGAPEWSGDFNAKDLAEGLRTILNKEKEG